MMEQDKSINVNTPQEDDRQLNEQEQEWARQQEELKSKLICNDTEAWSTSPADESQPRFVAGLDVSYDKNHPTEGCAALVIYDLQNKSLVYQDTAFVCVNTNYSAGFLAFREIGFLLDLVKTFRDKLKNLPDNIEPHVWLVDGNGLMHPRRFGLACHFGVLIDRPTIGVSKNPHFFLPGPRANRDQYKKDLESALNHRGDQFEILDEHSSVMGVALKSAESAKNPVYVSIGHRISLKSAVKVVLKCCVKFKNPEPVRQADMISREALRRR